MTMPVNYAQPGQVCIPLLYCMLIAGPYVAVDEGPTTRQLLLGTHALCDNIVIRCVGWKLMFPFPAGASQGSLE